MRVLRVRLLDFPLDGIIQRKVTSFEQGLTQPFSDFARGISGFGKELIVDRERKQREAKHRGCDE